MLRIYFMWNLARVYVDTFQNTAQKSLEYFFSKYEPEFVTFCSHYFCKIGIPTIVNSDPTLSLLPDLSEHLVPIRSTSDCSWFQSSHQITFFLFTKTPILQTVSVETWWKLIYSHPIPFYMDYYLKWNHTLSCKRSNASCRPTAFISVRCNADVMYICMSRKWPITPSCSDCSISSWDRSFTNHSKDFWSLLIQKKST